MARFDHKMIEAKWNKKWEESPVNVNDGNYKIASSAYGICSTAASTTAKTASASTRAICPCRKRCAAKASSPG